MTDYTPLRGRASRDEVAEYLAAAARGEYGTATKGRVENAPAGSRGIGCLVGGFIALIVVVTMIVMAVQGADAGDVTIGLVCLVPALLAGLGVWLVARAGNRGSARRAASFVAFGRANGLHVEPAADNPALSGQLFGHGTHRNTEWLVRWNGGETAMFSYWTEGGTRTWRYLAVELDRPVPHLAFRAGRQRGGFVPGVDWGTGTSVTEGTPYTLVAEIADHDAARAFFTDELIALCDDPEQPVNAEVTDGWFIGYPRPRNQLDADAYRQCFALAAAVRAAARRQGTAG